MYSIGQNTKRDMTHYVERSPSNAISI